MAFLLGFVVGMSFYLTHISWAALFLGPLPMTALATLESLFFALGAAVITLAYRWIPLVWPGVWGRAGLLPVVVAGLWTAREAIASVWPYGGFAWGRVSLSQSMSPFSHLFAWLGVSGVSFVMALLVALALELWLLRGVSRLLRVTLSVGAVAAILAVPAWNTVSEGTMRVAAVQGNGKAGYFDARSQGDLLQAQVTATIPVFGSGADVVVWPESGTDVSPLSSSYAEGVFDFVVKKTGAPLISGAITEREELLFNSSLLWSTTSAGSRGATDIYDKKHPVPFGEYVPDREFWRTFAPDLIDLIGRDYTPGTNDSVMNVNGTLVGVNICFDISDDQLMTETVQQGAKIIFAQSNNADFGRTDESLQQLAIARIRAIELGRSVVNISTVGTSAIIAPDGSTIDQLTWHTPGAMVADVPLRSQFTPAVMFGREFEWLVSFFGITVALLAGAISAGGVGAGGVGAATSGRKARHG
jgi:apolipoprotein N-acyltransferase